MPVPREYVKRLNKRARARKRAQKPLRPPAKVWSWIQRQWHASVKAIGTVFAYLPAAAKWAYSFVALAILAVLVYRLSQDSIVIEPINLPKEIEARGYTPTIAANLLRDALQGEEEEARDTLRRYRGLSSIKPISSQHYFQESISDEFYQVQKDRPTIQVPATGVSLDMISEFLRPLIGSQNRRISGHVASKGDKLFLHLRFDGKAIDIEEGSKDNFDALLSQAAAPILKKIRPRSMLLADEKDNEAWLRNAKTIAPLRKNLEAMCIHLIMVASKSPDDARYTMDELLKGLPRNEATLGWSYACKSDIEMMGKNESAAEKFAREAVKIRPNDAAARLALGLILVRKREYEGAIAEFDQGIEHSNNVTNDGRVARLYFHRGKARAEVKNYKSALENFDKAIHLDDTHCASYIERAKAYLRMDSIDKAIMDSESADRLCKEQKHAKIARSQAIARHAQALRAKGEIDTVIDKLREAIELHKKNTLALKDLGVAFLLKGQHSEAVTSLEQSIAAAGYNPPYTAIWLYLAQAKSGDAEARKDLQERSLTLEKNKWPYPAVWMFLGDLEPAGVLARTTHKSDKCEAYFHIGQWFLLQGERKRAMKCFQRVNSENCPKVYNETIGAKLELKDLQVPEANTAAKCA